MHENCSYNSGNSNELSIRVSVRLCKAQCSNFSRMQLEFAKDMLPTVYQGLQCYGAE